MDDSRFDTLARTLAVGRSRRGLVAALLAAAGLAAAGPALADKDNGGRDGGREHGRNRGNRPGNRKDRNRGKDKDRDDDDDGGDGGGGCLAAGADCTAAGACCQAEPTQCAHSGSDLGELQGPTRCCHAAGGSCSSALDCCAVGDDLAITGCSADGVCGGNGAFCNADANCLSGACRDYACTCLASGTACASATSCCQSEPTQCLHSGDDIGELEGPTRCCHAVGGRCASALDCCAVGSGTDLSITGCSDGGVCGGAGAFCNVGANCVSGNCQNYTCV